MSRLHSMVSRLALPGLFGAFLAGCAANPPAPASMQTQVAEPVHVGSGIYEASDPSNPRLRISLFLSPNHGFILRKTLGKDPLIEYRGQWTSDPDSLRLQVWDVRRPNGSDPALKAERLDTLIACPIQNRAAMPVPLLRLGSLKGGARLVQMSKPSETGLAWEEVESKSRGKMKRAGKPTSSSRKASKDKTPSGSEPPAPAPAAAKEKSAAVPQS